jgi:hypothetical protein
MKARSLVVTTAIVAAAALWVGTVGAAYRAIRRFESTPGRAAEVRKSWPAGTSLVRNDGAPTLVMLVHPHCSCSRASMQELQAIVEKSPRSLRTYVVLYRPHDAKPGWERTDIYTAATKLRGAQVVIDEDGREARRFGGFTSGQTFLYDGQGQLRFEGGVTLLRGHAGMNSGRADVIRLANAHAAKGTHPVFGCALLSRTEQVSRGETR